MNRAINQIQALPIYDMRSVLVLAMFLLIADSNKWKARELSSTSQYAKVFVDCKRQELSSTALVHCSLSKAIFSKNKYSFFLGTPTSGHPNFCTINLCKSANGRDRNECQSQQVCQWQRSQKYTTSSRKLKCTLRHENCGPVTPSLWR